MGLRPAQPVEVAPAYVFLSSQEANYISGEVIGVVGGESRYQPKLVGVGKSGLALAGADCLPTRLTGPFPVQTTLDEVVHQVQGEPDQEEYPRPQEDVALLLDEQG